MLFELREDRNDLINQQKCEPTINLKKARE